MRKYFNFDNTYIDLPKDLYSEQKPTAVKAPKVTIFNHKLAKKLGLDYGEESLERWAPYLSGNELPEGSQPVAQGYAGHQYGNFVMLGDGRAILLGEHLTPINKRYDIQLKGAGPTPYSRSGDGRGTLTSMLREYLISETMYAFGIPTTRSLAVVSTGEDVIRSRHLKGGILTRVSKGHIRIGTFQYASSQGTEVLKALADYSIKRFYPSIINGEHKYLDFFKKVIEKQSILVAKWQSVGFIHGVMNTDNVSIAGETIDYGPCAFMNTYHPKTVFSSIDRHGRYAYENQPKIMQWNLARLAEALLPLFHKNKEEAITIAEEALSTFDQHYNKAWQRHMRAKLGLFNKKPLDHQLINELLELMATHQLDFTNTFLELSSDEKKCSIEVLQPWFDQWYERRQKQGESWIDVQLVMKYQNPYVIPRNYLVEEALSAAETGNLKPFNNLLEAVTDPYGYSANKTPYTKPPTAKEEVKETFCNT